MGKGIARTSEVEFAFCPFCRNKLSFKERMVWKGRKKFTCSNCKKLWMRDLNYKNIFWVWTESFMKSLCNRT